MPIFDNDNPVIIPNVVPGPVTTVQDMLAPRTIVVGTPGPQGPSGSGGSGGVSFYASPPVYDTPENHGAKRNGIVLTGVTITHSTNTLTCTSASFSSADIGKHVIVMNPATGASLITTISSITNSTHVVLTSTVADFASTVAIYGTDDTAAIQAAIDTASAAAIANGSYYNEIWFSAGVYMVSSNPSTSRSGNAQIMLPIYAVGSTKMVTVFKGINDATALPHWQQNVPQLAGSYLCSTFNSGTNAAGQECVIGGPNVFGGYGPSGANLWSNHYIVIDGLGIMLPRDPANCGIDLIGVAEANVKSLAVLCFTTPAIEGAASPGYQSSSWSFGLQMPGNNNNDHNEIGQYSCESVCFGLILGEHTVANSVRCIYNADAVQVSQFAPLNHGAIINYLSAEAIYNCIYAGNGGNIRVNMLDWENLAHAIISDASNVLTGDIYVHSAGSQIITASQILGARNMNIYDSAYAPGAMLTTPTLPASGIAYPLTFRPTTYYLSGGAVTSITVDGKPTGVTSGPIHVPSGNALVITYTSTPTLNSIQLD